MSELNKMNKSSAQQRVDQIERFECELELLEKTGVLVLPQEGKQRVHDYHKSVRMMLLTAFDVNIPRSSKPVSLGMRVTFFLGAFVLIASLISLFYQYWGFIGVSSQATMLVAIPLLSFVATMWVVEKNLRAYFAKFMAVLTLACFVLNLVMLGQIFNMTPSNSIFLAWSLLAFLLAYICNFRLLLMGGILCAQVFVAMQVGLWAGSDWLSFGERPENFFLASIIIFVIPLAIPQQKFENFSPIYRLFGLIGFLVGVLMLSAEGSLSYISINAKIIEAVYLLIGLGLSAVAIWFGVQKHWKEVVNTGIIFFVLLLYTRLFDWWWELMPKSLFFLIIGLIAMLAFFVFGRLKAQSTSVGGA